MLRALVAMAVLAATPDYSVDNARLNRDRAFERNRTYTPPALSFLPGGLGGYERTGRTDGGFSLGGSYGETVTFARASTATCTDVDGTARILASGEPCVTGRGLLVEPAATNVQKRSEAIDTWSTAGTATVTTDTVRAPLGLTMDTISITGVGANLRFSSSTVSSSTGPFTYSGWGASVDGGAHTAGLIGECQAPVNVDSCSCVMENGQACWATQRAGPDQTACYGIADFGPTPVRMSVTYTCASAVTVVLPILTGGISDAGTGYAVPGSHAWGQMQVETGAVATSYIPTDGGVAATRAAVTVSTTRPSVALVPQHNSCVGLRFTPLYTGTPPVSSQTGLFDTRNTNNGIYMFTDNAFLYCLSRNSGAATQPLVPYSAVAGTTINAACKYDSQGMTDGGTRITAYLNNTPGTTTLGVIPTDSPVGSIWFGTNGAAGANALGYLSDFYWSADVTRCPK